MSRLLAETGRRARRNRSSAVVILCVLAFAAACGPVAIGLAIGGGGGGGSAPAATILELTDRPPPCTNQTTGSFRYAVSPNDTPCQYRVDGGDFILVQGGEFTVTVADGEHTIELTQVRDPNVKVEYRWTVDTVAPTAPAGLAASADRAQTLGLTWTPAVDLLCGVGNHIVTYRLLDAGNSADIDVPTASADARFDLGGLPNTRTVSVRVAAVDRAGNVGPPSAAVTARVRSGGDGTLGAATQIGPAVPGAGFLLAADFDGDKIPDLAVCQPAVNGGQVTILRGTGANGRPDGGFATVGTPYPVPGAAMLASGDFNADRRPDLAVVGTSPGSEVRILLGGAGGTFTAGQSLAQPGARCLAVADADVDGIRDLLVGSADPATRKVTVLRGLGGNGRGTGAFAATGFDVPVPFAPARIVAQDLNSDYSVDLAIACSGGANGLYLAQGFGDGTFSGAVPIAGVGGARDVVIADFTGDHFGDLAVLRDDGAGVQLVANVASGGCATGPFATPTSRTPADSPTLASLLVGDFDSDGRADLAAVGRVGLPDSNDGRVFVARQAVGGLGEFAAGFACGTDVAFAAAGDFDGSGTLDVVVSGPTAATPRLLRGPGGLGRGDGTFQVVDDPIFTSTSRQPFELVAGDFNRDGIVDLAACNQFSPAPVEEVVVLLGQGSNGIGTGTFAPAVLYSIGVRAQGIATGDVNNDGILDLVTANSDSSDLSVLVGAGDGTFETASISPLAFPSGPRRLVIGAFRHPGVKDVCAVGFNPGDNVRLYFGAGATCGAPTTLTPQTSFDAGPNLLSLAAADFDGDQVLDLALCSNTNDLVQVRLGPSVASGRGSGNFASATPSASLVSGDEPEVVVARDFTGDGRPDLLVTNRGQSPQTMPNSPGSVVLFVGRGDGTFDTPPSPVLSGFAYRAPNALGYGDFNADGIEDLVVGCSPDFGTNRLQVLIGNGADGVANGTFAAGPGGAPGLGVGQYPTSNDGTFTIVVADFDSDGVLDIVFTTRVQNLGGQIRMLKGRGTYQ